ncbi:hypothetical protein NIES4072_69190 [Nostoc commune NIES-4072]|uniref:Uncharacterized protein n=1 Tax=Nostoc commune NIES-4072 TaxID=2005467 RepID=A0A2R5FWT9_NOSCO|nr:hypothetical protein [Nostoc commune]BBD70552.1 hypothetical protein NIES4070_69630 [Nostoc commune HK-02]GBG23207.1 hypothetical protein NIES4072_69190 [Nostoc commune NIES-4072]
MNKYAVWFRRIVWLGVIQDWAIGFPAIFAPNWLLELLHQRPSQDPVWTSFAGLLVVLLSLFYIPGANDPYRYTANAVLATLSRPPGVLFFFFLYPNIYPAFGIIDLVLCLFQIPLLILTMLNKPQASTPDKDVFEYDGSTYNEVKEVGFSGPYGQPLPYHEGLGITKFLQFLNDSARNMFDKRDIRPYYDKLIHANGVCCSGIWRISEDSPYTGYFAKGSEGLVFARLSVAGAGIKRGDRRAFGIAGKVYPTLNPNEKVKPGNFVTVDYLTGIKTKHITDTELTNFPSVGLDIGANLVNRIIFRLMDKRPGFRQLFPISTLALAPGSKVVTPDQFMLRVMEGTVKIDAEDFRDELRLEKYPDHKLVYTINVKNFNEKEWTKLGVIEFNDYSICEGCDKRIHFWIPRDIPVPERDNLARPADPVVIK